MTAAQRLRLHLYANSLRWTFFVAGVAFVAVFLLGGWVALATSGP